MILGRLLKPDNSASFMSSAEAWEQRRVHRGIRLSRNILLSGMSETSWFRVEFLRSVTRRGKVLAILYGGV